VEEIARFRLEDVPFTLPARRAMFGVLTREQQLRRRVEDVLVGLGFAETYTPSLVPDDETTWKLPEPISVELTALRTTLIPSLVEAARRNVDAGASRIALFEIARVYFPNGELPNERLHVAAIGEGGFLHVKGVVEALYAALKAGPELKEIRVFDVYRGEQVGEGRKSIAFSVAYQSPERTLTEEDATRLRDRIVAELAKRFAAELRA